MISWKEYIKSNILKFRERYEEIPKEIRKQIEKKIRLFGKRLTKPCQVVVIDLTNRPQKSFIFASSEEQPDMETIVFKDLELEVFLAKAAKEPRLNALFSPKDILFITRSLRSLLREVDADWITATNYSEETTLLTFAKDPRSSPYKIADHFYHFVRITLNELDREKQRKKIEKTVDKLKRDVEAIPEAVELKNKIIENTRRLDGQIEELNKKVEEDVGSLRKLIGTSKEFLDWKAFSTDVKHLKETHIAKGVFDAHIKRIDEKIEKGLDALNTRIEDLKAIKFWSKRTLLEIALAIWGTIVSLYATGILKF